ncbi:CRISPR-associated protein Cas2 [Brevundimonas staleyi]|uniref:CRISPR-associated protein Cas2 n=1 Tax=Brevundimonas staleyi TaxID=74326 RepID=A0ABW0FX09_9CAUL
MAVHIVSYDLKAPGRNYDPLWARLREFAFAKPLESFWLIDTTMSAAQLRDDLLKHIDKNDRLFVARMAGESAWSDTISQTVKDWIWQRFPRG